MAVSYKHLKRMTDDTGMFQFANKEEPIIESGYTVDDNARALLAAISADDEEVKSMADIYLRFLSAAQKPDGGFTNLKIGNTFLPAIDSEDSIGRAFMACCFALRAGGMSDGFKQTSKKIIDNTMPAIGDISSLRAGAYMLIGLSALSAGGFGDPAIDGYAGDIGRHLKEAYRGNKTDTWKWYEGWLTYCNAVLPHALFSYYSLTGDRDSLDIAEESLGFLTDALLKKGYLSIVGNRGWWRRNSGIPNYDQQPVDAASTILACLEGYRVTGKSEYMDKASLSYEWYWGKNINKLSLYDEETGGCHDALIPDGLNVNQGAEATVSFLLADRMIKEVSEERRESKNGQDRPHYIPAV